MYYTDTDITYASEDLRLKTSHETNGKAVFVFLSHCCSVVIDFNKLIKYNEQ